MAKQRYGYYAKEPGVYIGRMAADGDGNIVAEDEENYGKFVTWVADNDSEEGHFEFVMEGEPSHNDRYHQQFSGVEPGGGSVE